MNEKKLSTVKTTEVTTLLGKRTVSESLIKTIRVEAGGFNFGPSAAAGPLKEFTGLLIHFEVFTSKKFTEKNRLLLFILYEDVIYRLYSNIPTQTAVEEYAIRVEEKGGKFYEVNTRFSFKMKNFNGNDFHILGFESTGKVAHPIAPEVVALVSEDIEAVKLKNR